MPPILKSFFNRTFRPSNLALVLLGTLIPALMAFAVLVAAWTISLFVFAAYFGISYRFQARSQYDPSYENILYGLFLTTLSFFGLVLATHFFFHLLKQRLTIGHRRLRPASIPPARLLIAFLPDSAISVSESDRGLDSQWELVLQAIRHHASSGSALERVVLVPVGESLSSIRRFVDRNLARACPMVIPYVFLQSQHRGDLLRCSEWFEIEGSGESWSERGWREFSEELDLLLRRLEREQGIASVEMVIDVTHCNASYGIAVALVSERWKTALQVTSAQGYSANSRIVNMPSEKIIRLEMVDA